MLGKFLDDMLQAAKSGTLASKLREYFADNLEVKPEDFKKFMQAVRVKDSSQKETISQELEKSYGDMLGYQEKLSRDLLNRLAEKAKLFYEALNQLLEAVKEEKSEGDVVDLGEHQVEVEKLRNNFNNLSMHFKSVAHAKSASSLYTSSGSAKPFGLLAPKPRSSSLSLKGILNFGGKKSGKIEEKRNSAPLLQSITKHNDEESNKEEETNQSGQSSTFGSHG